MYSSKSKLYRNVNHFLLKFPIQILNKFMKELSGKLSRIYFLQSLIYFCVCNCPIAEDQIFIVDCSRNVQNLVHFTRRWLPNHCLQMVHEFFKWLRNDMVRRCDCGCKWSWFSISQWTWRINKCDVMICYWLEWLYSGFTIWITKGHDKFCWFHDSESETTLLVVVGWFSHW
jgi:hypothetical protein